MNAAAIVLEPLVEAHAERLFPLLADADLWKFTQDEPPQSQSALAARYRRLESRTSPSGTQAWLNWAIVADGVAVGFVQATVALGRAEIAYVVGARYQGRGIAARAVREMIAIVTNGFDATLLSAMVDERNVPSVRLLARLGFARVDDRDPRNLRFEQRADAP